MQKSPAKQHATVVTPTTGRRELSIAPAPSHSQPASASAATGTIPTKVTPQNPSPVAQTASLAPVSPDRTGGSSGTSRSNAQKLYFESRSKLQDGDFNGACAQLEDASALDPANALVWNSLGYARMKLKRYKEALAALDRAIEINPRYKNAYQNRSAVKKLMGDVSGSARDRAQAGLIERHK
jgi:tetratricopeptide (TPR) repeat protein